MTCKEEKIRVIWSDGCVDEMTRTRVEELRCYKNLGKHIVTIEPVSVPEYPEIEPNDSAEQESRYLTTGCWR